MEHFGANILKDVLIVLAAAGLVIPLFRRLKLSPLIGFILVGVLVGPFGAGALVGQFPWLSNLVITEREAITPIAEVGVALLMFTIGLELSFERLKVMRRLAFGLGSLQVLVSAAALGFLANFLVQDAAAAAAIGIALALSSTAVIMQSLADSKRVTRPAGRAAFAVLLFQDLAVVPILFAIGMLGGEAQEAPLQSFLIAMVPGALAIGAIILLGRIALRPIFRLVAGEGQADSFVAACLLVMLGAGIATAATGLSMALGALVAGLLLAETEYRRQIEVTIEPFKGLLLGVFLISTGMSIDMAAILQQPLLFVGLACALVAVKALIVTGLGVAFGLSAPVSLRTGALLGPGGEFTFVVLSAAASSQLIAPDAGAFALALAAATMAVIPVLERVTIPLERRNPELAPDVLPPDLVTQEARVLVCGFGRVGRTVADMLGRHDVPFLAIDSSPTLVARERKAGRPIAYGDSVQIDLLRRCGFAEARALVITLDRASDVTEIVRAARLERPDLPIIARARDERHAAELYRLGATDAVPEALEASLVLCEQMLVDLGVPMGYVIASVHDKRAEQRAQIQALAPGAEVRRSRLLRPKGE